MTSKFANHYFPEFRVCTVNYPTQYFRAHRRYLPGDRPCTTPSSDGAHTYALPVTRLKNASI